MKGQGNCIKCVCGVAGYGSLDVTPKSKSIYLPLEMHPSGKRSAVSLLLLNKAHDIHSILL